jgi:hypothetical protein
VVNRVLGTNVAPWDLRDWPRDYVDAVYALAGSDTTEATLRALLARLLR